ncbi:MAG: cobyrinate a,c-diamide synthase, partial [Firmicutes bacterium]|nr:cobyrinate a,c-diamide synthase [Bacillota bacterium]
MTAYASTYEISQVTQSPVVLVVAAKGASLSVLATIQGFLNFVPDNRICGVILNQCTAMSYAVLAKEIQTHFAGKIRPLGFLPVMPKCSLESRHLGLITAAEVQGLREKLQILAEQAEQTLDLDGLLALAAEAPAVSCEAVKLPRNPQSVRIAVACDNAFCFYYEDSLDVLREMGAELVSFSPLSDTELPSDIHGLYLGGGYPELYAKELSENLSMLSSVKAALELGLPCIAECGGFMYLTESIGEFPMVGFLAGRSFDNGKLTRFGYVNLKASNDTLLGKAGTEIAAHEFHHWDSENPGNSFTAVKTSGKSWGCVHAAQRLYAGYPHFHFYSNPDFAVNFYNTCVQQKYKGETAL